MSHSMLRSALLRLPRTLQNRLPFLVVAAYLLGALLLGWTLQGFHDRSIALTRAESTGEQLRDLLRKDSWSTLRPGEMITSGPIEMRRDAGLSADLPPQSVPLILTIDNTRLRAAVAFNTPPKLPDALRARHEGQSASTRLAELSRGIARQDQDATLHVFLPDEVVLSVSAPTIWQARPSQTWIALIGLSAFVLGLSVVVRLALYLTGPFTQLAARGPVTDIPDPLASTEAVLIRDKITRLTKRFRTEQEKKERDLAAISHDLRTPVTRLRLRTELLPDDALRERLGADLDEVSNIIDGALDLLSLRTQPEESYQFSLASLLESLVNDYADTGSDVTFIAPEEVELQSATSIFSTPEEVRVRTANECLMRGQPDKLRRAFSNLIDNALKYGHRAEVEVRPHSSDMIAVAIRDYGPGIETDQIERLRQPFVRGHNPQGTRGLGLGLSIATELIELHGGTLDFTNHDPGLLATALVSRDA